MVLLPQHRETLIMQAAASRSRSQKVMAEARARVEMMSAEQQEAAMQRLLGKTAPEPAAVRAVPCRS